MEAQVFHAGLIPSALDTYRNRVQEGTKCSSHIAKSNCFCLIDLCFRNSAVKAEFVFRCTHLMLQVELVISLMSSFWIFSSWLGPWFWWLTHKQETCNQETLTGRMKPCTEIWRWRNELQLMHSKPQLEVFIVMVVANTTKQLCVTTQREKGGLVQKKNGNMEKFWPYWNHGNSLHLRCIYFCL